MKRHRPVKGDSSKLEKRNHERKTTISATMMFKILRAVGRVFVIFHSDGRAKMTALVITGKRGRADLFGVIEKHLCG